MSPTLVTPDATGTITLRLGAGVRAYPVRRHAGRVEVQRPVDGVWTWTKVPALHVERVQWAQA